MLFWHINNVYFVVINCFTNWYAFYSYISSYENKRGCHIGVNDWDNYRGVLPFSDFTGTFEDEVFLISSMGTLSLQWLELMGEYHWSSSTNDPQDLMSNCVLYIVNVFIAESYREPIRKSKCSQVEMGYVIEIIQCQTQTKILWIVQIRIS